MLSSSDRAASGSLPPFRVLNEFLSDSTVARLLQHTLSNESRFQPTTVAEGVVDPSNRVSMRLGDLGSCESELMDRFLAATPTLIAELRVSPFETSWFETELVAHGDGAFYKRHIDTATGKKGAQGHRLLSGVYYFNSQPKAFTGGALRLYAFAPPGPNVRFIDIEPIHNSLLVFPSWVPHEVLSVSCPSKRFVDSRFAINIWLWKKNFATAR